MRGGVHRFKGEYGGDVDDEKGDGDGDGLRKRRKEGEREGEGDDDMPRNQAPR